jgi:hypothetical protein
VEHGAHFLILYYPCAPSSLCYFHAANPTKLNGGVTLALRGVECGLRAARVAGSADMKMYTMCWLPLLLLSDSLMRVVSGASLQDNSAYQTCITSPSTCTILCVPPPFPSPCPPRSHECRSSCPRTR